MIGHVGDIFDPSHYGKVSLPLEDAEALPRWCFTSQKFYEREIERIFLQTWIFVGRADEVAKSGDYFTIEIAGEKGDIHVEGESVILRSNGRTRRWSCPPSLSEGSHHPDWFDGVAADFVAAATGGGKSNLDEAVLCARLIDAAQRSSAAGGVRLPLA